MDDLARLVAAQDIVSLEGRRHRLLDTKDWTGLAALHAPDFVSQPAQGDPVVGAEAMIAGLEKATANATTVHQGHTPEFEFDGPDRAHVTWAVEAKVIFRRPETSVWRHQSGWDFVDYERRDGRWLIVRRRQTRIRVVEGEMGAPGAGG